MDNGADIREKLRASAMEKSTLSGPPGSSWFNRISGVAERQFARGVATLKKLAVPEARLLDYQECRARVEKMAAESRGPERLDAMRRWAEILVEQEKHPVVQPVIVTQPASPAPSLQDQEDREESEEDWQQLSALPSTSVSGYMDRPRAATGGGVPAMYVDRRVEGGEPVSFRELFLRSNALESIIAGYSEEPPDSQEEEEILSQLVNACLGSSEEENEELLRDVTALARALGQCRGSGVAAPNTRAISENVVQAIKDLKRLAAVEVLEGKMRRLREEVSEQAATAAMLHKFNSGAGEPTGEVTRSHLTQGLQATKEVMTLGDALCKLAEQRSRIVSEPEPAPHAELIDELQTRASNLAVAVAKAEEKLEDNQQQRQDSRAFKDQKVQEMEGVFSRVQQEIQELQGERAVLLAQLEKIELALTKAQAHRADLEEGRTVFEEGTAFTIQGLEHEADMLCGLQNQHEAEIAALAKCRQLVGRASYALEKKRREDQREAGLAMVSAAEEYAHAATRHFYFSRAQLQLLLRQLNFCAHELSGLAEKQRDMSRLGMEGLLQDVAAQRHRLMSQYLDAESHSQQHLQQVADICQKVGAVVEQTSAAVAEPVPRSQECEEVAHSIHELRLVFSGLPRPEGLPPPGEKLAPVPIPGQQRPGSGDSKTPSRVPSASRSHDNPSVEAGRTNAEAAEALPNPKELEQQHDLGLDNLLLGSTGDPAPSPDPSSSAASAGKGTTPASSMQSAVSAELPDDAATSLQPAASAEAHGLEAEAGDGADPSTLAGSKPPERTN